MIVCAGALNELTERFFIGPIERVSRQALIMSQGKYDQTIDVIRQDEIGYLASSVNTMSEHLRADITKLQEVELKKINLSQLHHIIYVLPTIIKGNIDLLNNYKFTTRNR